MSSKFRKILSIILVVVFIVSSGLLGQMVEAEVVEPTNTVSVNNIPVILYHRIVATATNQWTDTSIANFTAHMDYLEENGYTTLSSAEYVSILQGQTTAPEKPILLTFDDATPDFITNVLPVLEAKGMKSVLFVISDWIDGDYSMSLAQLQSIVADHPSVSIENHSNTHEQALWTDTITYEDALTEISTANTFIKGITGKDPVLLAYPYGSNNVNARSAAAQSGIEYGFKVGYPNSGAYIMGRHYILDVSVTSFATTIGGPAPVEDPGEVATGTIVLNQSFEDGLVGGWSSVWGGPGTTVVSDVYGSDGTKSLKFTDRSSASHAPSLNLTTFMEAGKIYDVSLKVRLGEGSDSAHVSSKVNSPLLDNQYPWMMGNQNVTSEGWTTFEVKGYEVPDQTSELIIYVETTSSTSDIYIDEVLIKDVTPSDEPVIVPVTVLSQSFEDGLVGGWGSVWGGPGTTVVSDVYGSHGSKSLKFTDRSSNSHAPSLNLTSFMKSGKIYDVSLKVRLGEGSDSVHVSSKVNSPLLDNQYPWMMGNQNVTSESWTTFEVKGYEVPDQTSELIIYVETASSTADIYIDEVLVVEMTVTTPDEGELDQTGIVADFEDGIGSWAIRNSAGGSVEITTDDNYTTDGSSSLLTTVSTQYNGPILDVMGKMHKGHRYNLSTWVKMAPGQTATSLRISVQSGSSTFTNVSANVTATDEEWVELTGDFTVAVTPTVLNAYVETAATPASAVSFYMDDFVISYLGAVGPAKPIQTDLSPIKDIYGDYFLIGNAVSDTEFDGLRYELLTHHHNVVTAENAMKPESNYDENKDFDFTDENALVAKIEEAGLQLVGHVLVWHQQMPLWLSTGENNTPLTREVALQNLRTHITTVMENYGDKVISWDVVNEAISDGLASTVTTSNWQTALRQSPWYNAVGPDYVEQSFKIAREVLDAHPQWNVKLYYNDYNEDNQQKASAIYSMVKDINDRYAEENPGKLLIDGIGMQSHYNVNTNPENVRLSLEKFISLGVEVSITELDIMAGSNSEITEDQANAQGYLYAELMNLYKEYSDNIARVTFWGLDDATSWRNDRNPLLFDGDLQAKPAYYGVIDPDKFILDHPQESKVTEQGNAVFGTPVIDGTVDSIWSNAPALQVNQYQLAWQGATGVAKALWDEDNLYVLVQVQDSQLDDSNANAWEQDSVEIFVDQNNGKTAYYEEDNDGQYRINFNNVSSFNPADFSEGFDSETSISGTNYIVEVKIPLNAVTPASNMKLGFDVQINDAKDGSRQSVAAWNDTTGTGYMDPSVFGELTLVSSGTPAPTSTPASTSTPVPTSTPASSGTPVSTIIPVPTVTPVIDTGASDGKEQAHITVEATVDSTGNSTASISQETFKEALNSVKNESLKVEVKVSQQTTNVAVKLAAELVKTAADADVKKIEVNTGLATVELPVSLFDNSKEGSEIELQVIKVDTSILPEAVSKKVGNNTVFDFNLSAGGEKLSNFGANQKVQVSYPYTLEEGVKPGKVVIYYIDDKGNFEVVKNGRYNNGVIQFKTKHFSKYVAVPVETTLKDLDEASWAKESIEALATREILKGVSSDLFLPKKDVTRAEFAQMLVQAFDLKSEGMANPFWDVKEGAWYYKAVVTAYESGIIKGKTDGSFGVNEKISRQDMAVMTLSALKAAGINLVMTKAAVNFEDGLTISDYAKESVATMQRAEIISGMPNGGFAPKDTANRAQAAVILFKLLDEL